MSLFFPSILALALVVSLALVAVIYGLYVVVTVVQVASIVAYVVISYLVTLALTLVTGQQLGPSLYKSRGQLVPHYCRLHIKMNTHFFVLFS